MLTGQLAAFPEQLAFRKLAVASKLSHYRADFRFLFYLLLFLFSQNVPQGAFEFRIAEYKA